MKAKSSFEDVYPLSPLQQGMLFHATLEPEAGLYLDQLVCRLEAPRGLDAARFQRAWETLIQRHTVLRTAFSWRRRDRPLQVVLRRLETPFEQHDWRHRAPTERERDLERLLVEDRKRGFDLARAPLLRLVLIRFDERDYRFLLSYHHILLDAWSLSLVLGELFTLYGARDRGLEQEGLLPLRRPYRDYIAWLRRQDAGEAEAVWRRELAGITAPTPLWVDRLPRQADAASRGYTSELTLLSVQATTALEATARRHRLTLNHLVRGAWGLLLGRYSDEADVVFGATVSGRPDDLQGVESMVGLFINTLPVRVRVGRTDRLRPWLERIRDQQLRLRPLEASSLVEVQGWSQVPRNLPLFETILVFENVPGQGAVDQAEADGLRLVDLRYEPRSSYALSVMVTPGRRLSLRILYPVARFDAATVRRLQGHLRTLLEALPEGMEQPLEALPMATGAERWQLLGEWQDTAQDYGRGRSIHQLFASRAERAPEAAALLYQDEVLSYGELERRSNRLAHHLRSLGAGPGAQVGVLMSRSPDMVSALLAILGAGASYLPLETAYPRARVEWLLASQRVPCTVTQERHLEVLEAMAPGLPALADVIAFDAAPGVAWQAEGGGGRPRLWGRQEVMARPQSRPASLLGPEAIAYTIFTSGSTGTPKGVVVRQRPVVNLIEWAMRTFEFGPGDRALFITALSFDLSVFDLFGLLAAGGSVRIVPEAELGEPRLLLRRLITEPVTFWDSAPVALQQLVPFLPEVSGQAAALRLVFLSGDWVPVALPGQLAGVFPRARVIALGGATEATVWSNFHPVERRTPRWSSVPYGRPMANAAYYVLDRALRPCPAGVPGDLFIGGECLASAYAGEAALTAGRFMPDPFGARRGERLYRTGDRSRFWPDGTLEFLGRLDQQVKIRGFRIELGEIETHLGEHPRVQDAVVLAPQDGTSGRRLVAYVVGRGEAAPAAAELRSFLSARLPEPMLPAVFVPLDALPVTANGKVDRTALARLPLGAEEGGARPASRPVRTPGEELVAGIWREVLGVQEVGAGSDFFELGGHSLLATQVISRVREVFGVELPMRSLFAGPTVEKLAAEVAAAMSPGAARPPIERVPAGTPTTLSYSQERAWVLSRMDTGGTAYKIPAAVRLSGLLHLSALSEAWRQLARRHDALRTIFTTVAGEPVQVVAAGGSPEWPLVDLTALAPDERERAARGRIASLQARPFDLERGPLVSMALLRLDPRQHVVGLSVHHIVSDAWSMELLVSELVELYVASVQGRSSRLPELPFQYADFACWQRSWLAAEALGAQLDYWRRQLGEPPPALRLPGARRRPAAPTFQGALERLALPPTLVASLAALGRREGATLFMTLMTAFQALLALYTGERDIAVGTDIANRNQKELEGVVGYFANILVLRTDLSGDPSFRQALARTREAALEAYAHQDVPFERVIETVRPGGRAEGRSPFQAKLVFQEVPVRQSGLPDLTVERVDTEHRAANFDLTLFVTPAEEGLNLALEHNTDLYDAATARRLLADFEAVLRQAVEAPESRLSALSLLGEEQKRVAAASFSADLEGW